MKVMYVGAIKDDVLSGVSTFSSYSAKCLERIIVCPIHYQAMCACARHYCIFVTLVNSILIM